MASALGFASDLPAVRSAAVASLYHLTSYSGMCQLGLLSSANTELSHVGVEADVVLVVGKSPV